MMKHLLLILFLILTLTLNFTFAQSDSSKTPAEDKRQKTSEDQIIPSFEKHKKKKDVFIDKDGDGICDDRVEGMSFQKMRKRKQHGKEGKGHGGRK
jgi:hypothetical protein